LFTAKPFSAAVAGHLTAQRGIYKSGLFAAT